MEKFYTLLKHINEQTQDYDYDKTEEEQTDDILELLGKLPNQGHPLSRIQHRVLVRDGIWQSEYF